MKGNFLKSKTVREIYKASFIFNKSISVDELGTYRLSFYTFFSCYPVSACLLEDDAVAIKIKQGVNGVFEEVYKTGSEKNRTQDYKWIKEETLVQIQESVIFVCDN